MEKSVKTDSEILHAKFVGTVKRVAKLVNPHRQEFTVDVRETEFNNELFTIGTRVTFEVQNALLVTGRILPTLTNLTEGDEVNIELNKIEDKWQITALSSSANRGRPVEDFLKDLEEEQNARK